MPPPPGPDCASEPEEEHADEDAPALQDAVTVQAAAEAAGPVEGSNNTSNSIFGSDWRPVPVASSTEGVTPLLYIAVGVQAVQRATGLTARGGWLLCAVALLAYWYGKDCADGGAGMTQSSELHAVGDPLTGGTAQSWASDSEGGGCAAASPVPCLCPGDAATAAGDGADNEASALAVIPSPTSAAAAKAPKHHAVSAACPSPPPCAAATCPECYHTACLRLPRAHETSASSLTTPVMVDTAAGPQPLSTFFGLEEEADPYPTFPPDPPSTTTPDRTHLHCTDDDINRRSCLVENVCHDSGAGRWLFYMGEEDKPSSSSDSTAPCLSLGTDTGGHFCDGAPFVHLMGLMYDEAMLRPFILPGRPPAPGPGVHWYTRDQALLYITARHHPMNYFHSVADDYFALYWGLRRALRHPAYAPAAGGSDPVGATTSSTSGPRVVVVLEDSWGPTQATQRLAARFHHVSYLQPAELHTQSSGARVVCFRGAALGSPGITLQRNAASVYSSSRVWKAPINAATQHYDARAYASFFTHSLLHQASSSSGSGSALPQPPQLDAIVLLTRPLTRAFKDVEGLLGAMRAVAGPFEVMVASFEHMGDEEIARLLRRTAVLIGVHGAGLANMLYMQPGTTLFEITPPSDPETLAFFSSLTYTLGLRHVVLPALPGGDFNAVVDVNLGAFKALLDIALQDYDTRDPT